MAIEDYQGPRSCIPENDLQSYESPENDSDLESDDTLEVSAAEDESSDEIMDALENSQRSSTKFEHKSSTSQQLLMENVPKSCKGALVLKRGDDGYRCVYE